MLGVHCSGRFGALGLSRRVHLMYKPCSFPSLAALIREYEQRYAEVGHTLLRVRVGLPIPPSRHSTQAIAWRHVIVVMRGLDDDTLRMACEQYMRRLRRGTVEEGRCIVKQRRRGGGGGGGGGRARVDGRGEGKKGRGKGRSNRPVVDDADEEEDEEEDESEEDDDEEDDDEEDDDEEEGDEEEDLGSAPFLDGRNDDNEEQEDAADFDVRI